MTIEQSEGYKKLLAAIQEDMKSGPPDSRMMKTLTFAVERAQHYAEHTGLDAGDILTAWESRRDYGYLNYYQDANQPLINAANVRVFTDRDQLMAAIGESGFRCPHCNGVSTSAYECDSGVELPLLNSKEPKPCNWKVYGLFGDLGKGCYVFVKDQMRGSRIFMPIAWETAPEPQLAESVEA